MIRVLLMFIGLLLSVANIPVIYVAIASYYIFVRLTMSQRKDIRDNKHTSFSKKIVYIDYALLLCPIIIYFLHPDTDKDVLIFMWKYFTGKISSFFP